MLDRIKTLAARRTQLLDELWNLDKELTRLEAQERERQRAALPPRRRAKRQCIDCGRRSSSVMRGLCTRCRGIARSKRIAESPVRFPNRNGDART